jgi:RsiW-degrading membrane proteinase PrsW (M82 family)
MGAPQKSSSPFVASRMIRVIAVTFVALWLFHVLYDDPTRGTINLAVSRIYLIVGGLFIVLAIAFNAVASCVKTLEERVKRLEQTHTQCHNQG